MWNVALSKIHFAVIQRSKISFSCGFWQKYVFMSCDRDYFTFFFALFSIFCLCQFSCWIGGSTVVKTLIARSNHLIVSIYLIIPRALCPGVYSASKRNEYQRER
jgi:hypothetical protein